MSERPLQHTTNVTFGWFSLLGVIFICAKVFAIQPVAHWSWLWVLAPFWVPAAVGLSIVALLVILIVVAAIANAALQSPPKLSKRPWDR